MALVNVQERWSDVNGDIERMNIMGANKWTGAKAFTVLFDAQATPQDAFTAAGIPLLGDHYSVTFAVPCRRKRAVALGPLLFDVTCEYAGQSSPLLAPDEIAWQEASASELVDYDEAGDLLVNTIGQPYQRPRDVADGVYVCTRNEAIQPDAVRLAYWNTVNSDVLLGIWPAETARMLPITSVMRDDGAVYYYRVTYRVQFRAGGWREHVPNKGTKYRDVPGGPLLRVYKKLQVNDALLRENGTLLNDTGTAGAEATVWLTPLLYSSVAFAPLGIF